MDGLVVARAALIYRLWRRGGGGLRVCQGGEGEATDIVARWRGCANRVRPTRRAARWTAWIWMGSGEWDAGETDVWGVWVGSDLISWHGKAWRVAAAGCLAAGATSSPAPPPPAPDNPLNYLFRSIILALVGAWGCWKGLERSRARFADRWTVSMIAASRAGLV